MKTWVESNNSQLIHERLVSAQIFHMKFKTTAFHLHVPSLLEDLETFLKWHLVEHSDRLNQNAFRLKEKHTEWLLFSTLCIARKHIFLITCCLSKCKRTLSFVQNISLFFSSFYVDERS